jgi:hypothetical protein
MAALLPTVADKDATAPTPGMFSHATG